MGELLRLGLGGGFDLSRVVLIGALAAARVVPVFVIMPAFGGRLVAPTIRVAIALAFVAILFPALDGATPSLSPGPLVLGVLIAKEVVVGLAIGFLAAMPLWAAEAAGRLADTARGAGQGELTMPQTGTATSPLGDFAFQLAIVLFFAVDGHLLLLRALAGSFEALPLASFPRATAAVGIGDLVVRAVTRLLVTTIGLAAPVLAAMLLGDLALGLVNRVAPQVQVFFLGMPAKATLGVAVLVLALSGVALAVRRELAIGLLDAHRAVELLAPSR